MHLKYHQAIHLLNSLQNSAQTSIHGILKNEPSFHILQMQKFLSRLSMHDAIDQLSTIHIAGTKGKGSTAAFCESIMRHHGLSTGLYTSPHLKTVIMLTEYDPFASSSVVAPVRERIKLNGQSISESLFTESFFHIWHTLEQTTNLVSVTSATMTESGRPSYFEFLTLMAFHIFTMQKVDIAVIEVGLGGLYDATNVLKRPLATLITSLGMDHMQRLGHSIEEIAYNKAGIMKNGIPCYTMISQPPAALQVLYDYAVQMESPLTLCDKSILKKHAIDRDTQLGICGDIQYENASLAIHACEQVLQDQFPSIPLLPSRMKAGLEATVWPGRTQMRQVSERLTFYFDGAHTIESVRVCIDWFQKATRDASTLSDDRVLVFYCSGDRDPRALLRPIFESHCQMPFSRIFFTANECKESSVENWKSIAPPSSSTLFQESCVTAWQDFFSDSGPDLPVELTVTRHLDDVIEQLSRSSASHTRVLVTGSLHLVGNFFHILNIPVL